METGGKFHIGKLIQTQVKSQHLSNAEFARRLNCDRSVINYMYKQESIDLLKLIRISKILNYDFIGKHCCNNCAAQRDETIVKQLYITNEDVSQLKEKGTYLTLKLKIG